MVWGTLVRQNGTAPSSFKAATKWQSSDAGLSMYWGGRDYDLTWEEVVKIWSSWNDNDNDNDNPQPPACRCTGEDVMTIQHERKFVQDENLSKTDGGVVPLHKKTFFHWNLQLFKLLDAKEGCIGSA